MSFSYSSRNLSLILMFYYSFLANVSLSFDEPTLTKHQSKFVQFTSSNPVDTQHVLKSDLPMDQLQNEQLHQEQKTAPKKSTYSTNNVIIPSTRVFIAQERNRVSQKGRIPNIKVKPEIHSVYRSPRSTRGREDPGLPHLSYVIGNRTFTRISNTLRLLGVK